MDRAEKTGFGVAVAGHVVLFGLLSVGFLATPNPIDLRPRPIEVTLSDEVGLESAAPVPTQEEPAPRLAEVEGPVEPVAPPPAPAPEPQPAPRPVERPAPTPKPAPKPTPKPPRQAERQPPRETAQRPKPQQRVARPTGRLAGITDGLTDRQSNSRSTTPPAATAGPAVKSALAAELIRQLKPHWQRYAPTGGDVELLRTVVEARLSRDGSIIGEPRVVSQTGINATNRSQAELHKEMAIKAVKVAAPFKFPAEFYDEWKVIRPALDRKLQ